METCGGLREFLAYHRKMRTLLTAVCASVACVLYAASADYAWLGGFAAGAAAQLVKFSTLDVWLVERMALEPENAATQLLKSRYGSLGLLAAAVAATWKFSFNVWAMAAGIFLPRLILLADACLRPDVFAKSSSTPETDAGSEREAQRDR